MNGFYGYNPPFNYSHEPEPNPQTSLERVKNRILSVYRDMEKVRSKLEDLEAELNSALKEIEDIIREERQN